MNARSNITCSVGILTHNSSTTLTRCLESIKDFSDIIIADGGSTDSTIEIAKHYGVRVIPQSNPGSPITDFAKERNLLLACAKEKWFFYVDSDEIVSRDLVEEIKTAVTRAGNELQAYRVRYLKTNADASKIYRTFKEYYQMRLFRTDIGAVFERAIHERIQLPAGTPIGQLEGAWYVLLDDDDLSFSVFTQKAWKRIGYSAQAWKPRGVFDVLRRIVFSPATQVAKSLFKIVAVKVLWGTQAIPTQYELLRVWYALMYSAQHARRVTEVLFLKKS